MATILKNFWVLEGLDGSGTTTQLRKLEEFFRERKIKCLITQEPTGLETGLLLRNVLSGKINASQSTIAYLFAADRDNHLNNKECGILSALDENKITVSDRYLFSSLAYQSIGFDYEKVKKINSDFPLPEHIIYIDTPPEDCMKRIDARGKTKEIFEKISYQRQIRENYERCFSELPAGCKLTRINGNLSIDEIFLNIRKALCL